ncbi:MAG: MBL fold metallo-hydrolase [Bacteroidales bacterium]|nr:MBL fold metallo-hydrolase [Bacteroidales bacterium]
MNYKIISTGSKGNAVFFPECGILIDCGVSFASLNDIRKDIKIILLTHRHSDHLNKATLKRLMKERPSLRVGCMVYMYDILTEEMGIPAERVDVYGYDLLYDYGEWNITPFPVPHNVPNCGYILNIEGKKIFYATDSGNLDHVSAEGCDMYFIEANYGEDEIQDRISEKKVDGRFIYERDVLNNHLSYEQAMDFLIRNNTKNAEYVLLHGHIEE